MTSVNAALLFVGNPTLALEHFLETLSARLARIDIDVEEISPENKALISFRAGKATVSVTAASTPLPADRFKGSLESPLSKPVIGVLAETLARHTRHITVTVSALPAETPNPTNLLTQLQILHATSSLLAEWHMPAAVHWQQSNQLLSGAQYLQLATEACPWALFAKVRIIVGGEIDQMPRSHALQMDDALQFIQRPVHFAETQLPIDQIHAAALAFLRHAVQTGAPIADGHSFGPQDGPIFQSTHIDASPDLPHGMYELSVVHSDADAASGETARPPRAILLDPDVPLPVGHPLADVAAPSTRVRTRSMAISYLMLVIMPPVGAILLMSNAIFGSNVLRTGTVALASVALAVAVGAYAFVNNGQNTALLFDNAVVQSVILAD